MNEIKDKSENLPAVSFSGLLALSMMINNDLRVFKLNLYQSLS